MRYERDYIRNRVARNNQEKKQFKLGNGSGWSLKSTGLHDKRLFLDKTREIEDFKKNR